MYALGRGIPRADGRVLRHEYVMKENISLNNKGRLNAAFIVSCLASYANLEAIAQDGGQAAIGRQILPAYAQYMRTTG